MDAEKPSYQRFFTPSEFPVFIYQHRGNLFSPFFLSYHREVELQFVKRGQGAYLIGKHNYPIGKNSLLIIKPSEIHRFIPEPDSYIEKTGLNFPLSLFEKETGLSELFSANAPHCLQLSENEATRVEVIFQYIHTEAAKREKCWQEIITAEIRHLLFLLKRIKRGSKPKMVRNKSLEKILGYIEAEFAKDLTVYHLGDFFAYSPNYISGLVKKHTGLGLKQFILQRRIVEAKRLLEETPFSVNLISRRVGFQNFTLFNRNFKIITGITPSAYRGISHQNSGE